MTETRETAPEVPEPIRAIARRAFAGRPPDADGVFALLSDRNPWRALDEALAAALPAHGAMVREDLLDSACEEMERYGALRGGFTPQEAAGVMSLSERRVEAYERSYQRLEAMVRHSVAEDIEAACPNVSITSISPEVLTARGMTKAARIARGEQP